MLSSLIFIGVLSVLVVVHEFGHFIVARWVGIRVEKFSIGFGPVIFGKKFGETEFCFSLLPLGGFVKMAGESAEEATGHPWEFNSKPLLQKFMVVFAGPVMNAVLAFVFFSFIFMAGQPIPTSKIGKVLQGAPAAVAGLRDSDEILSVNGHPVKQWDEVLAIVRASAERTVFSVKRGGDTLEFTLTPQTHELGDIFGKKHTLPFVGISPSSDVVYVKSGFFESFYLGAKRVWDLSGMIFLSLGLMITGAMPFKDSLTGPIGIFFMTQEAAHMGILYLLSFMGSLSVSLFVLNLLPIPVLDGGHVLFISLEKLKGSPLKESTKERMTQVGMFLLLGLMAFVILQDVHRFAIVDHLLKWVHKILGK